MMTSNPTALEWQRLRQDFETEASRYHDLTLSLKGANFQSPHHVIALWQYLDNMSNEESISKIMSSIENATIFGLAGAALSAYAVIEGRQTDLFCRMASNVAQRGVDWQMRIDDARTKLKSVYPTIKL